MSNFPFDPHSPAIIVDCEIEGKIVYHALMVVDTGATLTILPWRLINGIGIEVDPKNLISTTTATTVESVPIVHIPKITFLDKTVRNVPCLVKNLPPKTGVDGLLGLSFLKHFKVLLDFKNGVLSIV